MAQYAPSDMHVKHTMMTTTQRTDKKKEDGHKRFHSRHNNADSARASRSARARAR